MSIAAAENAGPGPCDLQDPLWVKMNAITGNITKKRKKSDAKPQSQINKCLNEKRRRTQENLYIDELAELVSVSDMSSGKTDKCQILQRTVDQIRQINDQSGSNSHDVQQGEVSSSNPSILSNDQVGPILLEALDGFLFVVNTEGRVEYVTDNVKDYINFTKDEVLGKDIYNIIHIGDAGDFMPNVLPQSVAGWTGEAQGQQAGRNRTFECRFLVKAADEKDETMEEKQQRVSQYETMQICSALLPASNGSGGGGGGGDNSSNSNSANSTGGQAAATAADAMESGNEPCVMCVARRISLDEKRVGQFTFKIDTHGKILAVDTSWLNLDYKKSIEAKDLVNRKLHDLCHLEDLSKITTHLKDVLQVGESMSPIYRLSFCLASPPPERKYFNVQTKSKLFKGSVTSGGGYESDFIMATNSLFRTDREDGIIDKCPSHSLSSGIPLNSRPSNNNNNVGGPLMSVAGQLNGMSTSTSSSSPASTGRFPGSSSTSSYATSFNHFSTADIDAFDLFPSSTLDLELDSWTPIDNSRPDSRASNQQSSQSQSQQQQQHQSNSRPASQPNAAASSPHRAFSPATHAFGNSFSFSPLQDTTPAQPSPAMEQQRNGPSHQDTDNCQQQQSQQPPQPQQPSVSTESGRLRNLLTKGSSASDDSCQDNSSTGPEGDKPGQQNRILKILLNQQDEDEYHPSADQHGAAASSKSTRGSPAQPMVKTEPSKPSVSSGNHMLLQLLNEKNEDDEDDRGMKKKNELLTQLLKDTDDDKKHQDQNRDDDPLLRSLGFRNASPSSSQLDHVAGVSVSAMTAGQKRPVEDCEMNIAVKRPMDGSQVTSTASSSSSGTSGGQCGPNSTGNTSKLWEKNRMLASLLAKQPTQPATIPPIPASVISATPQDKLPRVINKQQPQQQQPNQQQQQQQQQPWTSMQSAGSNATTTTATSARTPMQNQRSLPHRQPAMNYLNQLQQRVQMEQMDIPGSRDYRQLGNDPPAFDADDPDLSQILDQVIDIVPESLADNTIASLMDVVEAQRNEKQAINAIQESLMQIETAVNPTSSNMTTPGTPPAYSTAMGNTPVTSSHNYQRPPIYQQQSQQQQPRARLNAVQQAGIRQAAAQFTPQQQQMQLQQRQKMLQVQQRLLQQQQQQQLLIPSNATAPDQIASGGIHNIDTLLNNTVAPNVTLQRSGGPESQVSPSYGGSVQMPQGPHRLTHSYSHPSTLPQHPAVNNSFNSGQQATARLSPHSPAGILPFSHPQPLSPRVTQQGSYAGSPRMFNVNQVRQQQQQQQSSQQPGLQQQPQRSMSSPGTPVSARQSPFPAEAFPPPASPTASQFPPVPNASVTNPSAQYRMQRQASTPSATTQLPGGVGSPCHYGGVSKDQPLLSPSHPHAGCPATPTHNQHNANNTQHFSNHQHSSMLYHNAASVQNSQYCYDRTSVNMYQSGPGDAQDCRPPPPSNPASHQMGGNTTGNAGGINSEYVRKELRTVVDARMQQQQQQQQRVPNNFQNNLSGQVSQEDLDTLGLNYDLTAAGDALVSDGSAKSWAIGNAGTTLSSSRTTMEEVSRGDPKSSLLQKLLSE
ncbi:nuclear receptor coactivator 3 [Phymastichus coffea]|uniref:nuclear receptor coactivator 3 n=1 Tax=Phymastichus coffea TaxID=108790 RepID=UPI00273A919E|nr:nuclear receptor coactivator 3 [Phymastichus coffea]